MQTNLKERTYFYYETERLKLLPLDLACLLLLQEDRRLLEEKLGLAYSAIEIDANTQAEIDDALLYWIKNVNEDPENWQWFTGWEIILKEENKAVGGIGFIGLPDAQGATQVGYHIDKNYHKKGLATEALKGITDWALSHNNCRVITADTLKDNLPSQKVLSNNGFRLIKEKEDGLLLWKKMGRSN